MTDSPTSVVAFDRNSKRGSGRKTYHQRRKEKLQTMQATVAALERALPVMLTLDDDDVHWHGFLDDEAMRVRNLMLQNLQLTRQAYAEVKRGHQLQKLLQEYRITSYAIARIHRDCEEDSWEDRVVQWSMITRKHFKPWTAEDCQSEVETAIKDMYTLMWSEDVQSTGQEFLGWRERRRVDLASQSIKFLFQKEFRGLDIPEFASRVWTIYTNADAYQQATMGARTRSALDVLQRISPSMLIMRYDEQYPSMTLDVHILYLVFRVETDGGYMVCIKSLFAPELEHAIDGSRDAWASNCIWYHFDRMNDTNDHCRLSIGGSMSGADINYVKRWRLELLAAITRGEAMVTGNQIVHSA